MKNLIYPLLGGLALTATACASNGQYTGTSRDAAIGGAVGAVAGAVIGGEGARTEGAVIGGAIGAAAGGAYGCTRDKVCPWNNKSEHHSALNYDSQAKRNYYVYGPTGDTYWQSGEFRSAGQASR